MIIQHTELVAEKLAETFADDPSAELSAWISLAHQREAMVVELYAGDAQKSRLSNVSGPPELIDIVRRTVSGIWAQEASHTALMGSLRKIDSSDIQFQRAMGSLEGKMTHLATSSGPEGIVARWLIGLGRLVGKAPEFTRYLGEVDLNGFFELSRELEHTAASGYSRIVSLIDDVEAVCGPNAKFGITAVRVRKNACGRTISRSSFRALVDMA